MSKARILADLISDSQITASEVTGLALNSIQTGDTSVEVLDTGTDGKIVVKVDNEAAMEIGKNSMAIPKGTTAERNETPTLGELRYNTDIGFFETYTSAGWGSIATPPLISAITPTAFDGSIGTSFTISGNFFDADSTVQFKGADGTLYSAATVTFVDDTTLTATNASVLPVANEPFKVVVTGGSGLSATSVATIDAGSTPTWTTASGLLYTTATYDEVISGVTVAATDDDGQAITYALTSGSLPTGVTFDAATQTISGTADPQATTTYTFEITATDSVGNANPREFSLKITNGAPVWVTELSTGITEGAAPNTLVATDPEGTAVSYSVTSGSLPTGLTLNSDGTWSGTPTTVETGTVTIRATDAQGSYTDSTVSYEVAPSAGEVLFATTGTHSWIAPAGVTSVSVVCVGGGGAGGVGSSGTVDGGGGGGGSLAYKNNITVSPGTSYTVVVGAGGTTSGNTNQNGGNGGSSSFTASFGTCTAGGGYGGQGGSGSPRGAGGSGGTVSGSYDGGGGGGTGGTNNGGSGNAGGGGGAGGYSGSGGNGGGFTSSGQETNATAGAGGGGGGGRIYTPYGNDQVAGGGGVGIFGQGSNGAAGTNTSYAAGGGGGSGGADGADGSSNSAADTGIGGAYGGGGGGNGNQNGGINAGGVGAVRIIWGDGRAFPSTNVDLASSGGNVTTI
jgi:hypothetical protein